MNYKSYANIHYKENPKRKHWWQFWFPKTIRNDGIDFTEFRLPTIVIEPNPKD